MNLTEQLKAKILEAPSVNSVAVASGVPQPVLNRFVRGDRDIYLATANKLAAYFGLSLQPDGETVKPTKSPRKPAKAGKAKSKPRPSARPRSAAVSRVRGFVDAYGAANDVGGIVGQLPRNHSKRKAIATMLWAYRNEAGLRAWRRKGEYR